MTGSAQSAAFVICLQIPTWGCQKGVAQSPGSEHLPHVTEMETGLSVPAGQELLCRTALGSQQIRFLPAQLHGPASPEGPGVFGCKVIALPEGWSRKCAGTVPG